MCCAGRAGGVRWSSIPGRRTRRIWRRSRAMSTSAGQRIELILLTHGHEDHSAGAPALARQAGVPVRALDPAHRLGSEGLGDGDVVSVDDLEIHVIAAPGHSGDSLCFLLPDLGEGSAGPGRGGAHRGHGPRPRDHRSRPSRRPPR